MLTPAPQVKRNIADRDSGNRRRNPANSGRGGGNSRPRKSVSPSRADHARTSGPARKNLGNSSKWRPTRGAQDRDTHTREQKGPSAPLLRSLPEEQPALSPKGQDGGSGADQNVPSEHRQAVEPESKTEETKQTPSNLPKSICGRYMPTMDAAVSSALALFGEGGKTYKHVHENKTSSASYDVVATRFMSELHGAKVLVDCPTAAMIQLLRQDVVVYFDVNCPWRGLKAQAQLRGLTVVEDLTGSYDLAVLGFTAFSNIEFCYDLLINCPVVYYLGASIMSSYGTAAGWWHYEFLSQTRCLTTVVNYQPVEHKLPAWMHFGTGSFQSGVVNELMGVVLRIFSRQESMHTSQDLLLDTWLQRDCYGPLTINIRQEHRAIAGSSAFMQTMLVEANVADAYAWGSNVVLFRLGNKRTLHFPRSFVETMASVMVYKVRDAAAVQSVTNTARVRLSNAGVPLEHHADILAVVVPAAIEYSVQLEITQLQNMWSRSQISFTALNNLLQGKLLRVIPLWCWALLCLVLAILTFIFAILFPNAMPVTFFGPLWLVFPTLIGVIICYIAIMLLPNLGAFVFKWSVVPLRPPDTELEDWTDPQFSVGYPPGQPVSVVASVATETIDNMDQTEKHPSVVHNSSAIARMPKRRILHQTATIMGVERPISFEPDAWSLNSACTRQALGWEVDQTHQRRFILTNTLVWLLLTDNFQSQLLNYDFSSSNSDRDFESWLESMDDPNKRTKFREARAEYMRKGAGNLHKNMWETALFPKCEKVVHKDAKKVGPPNISEHILSGTVPRAITNVAPLVGCMHGPVISEIHKYLMSLEDPNLMYAPGKSVETLSDYIRGMHGMALLEEQDQSKMDAHEGSHIHLGMGCALEYLGYNFAVVAPVYDQVRYNGKYRSKDGIVTLAREASMGSGAQTTTIENTVVTLTLSVLEHLIDEVKELEDLFDGVNLNIVPRQWHGTLSVPTVMLTNDAGERIAVGFLRAMAQRLRTMLGTSRTLAGGDDCVRASENKATEDAVKQMYENYGFEIKLKRRQYVSQLTFYSMQLYPVLDELGNHTWMLGPIIGRALMRASWRIDLTNSNPTRETRLGMYYSDLVSLSKKFRYSPVLCALLPRFEAIHGKVKMVRANPNEFNPYRAKVEKFYVPDVSLYAQVETENGLAPGILTMVEAAVLADRSDFGQLRLPELEALVALSRE